METNKIPRRM